jgi:hypothetical protein
MMLKSMIDGVKPTILGYHKKYYRYFNRLFAMLHLFIQTN